MVNYYDIDYLDSFNQNMHPPFWRLPKFLAWMRTLLTPIAWLHKTFFYGYINSGNYIHETQTTLAYKGQQIRFWDSSVWECQIDGTNILTQSPSILPQNWIKVLDDCIGLVVRENFNNQKVVMEYLLNLYFNINNVSPGIYITNIFNTAEFWLVDLDSDLNATYIGATDGFDDALFWIYETDNDSDINNSFIVNIPTSILDLMEGNLEKIYTIINRYNNFGVNYEFNIY